MTFLDRLKELALDDIILQQEEAEAAYQSAMAAVLREKTFLYLKGKLYGRSGALIPDGPAVKELRRNLEQNGKMDKFVSKQSPEGAWATDLELTLLAELLDTNLIVETTVTRANSKPIVLSPQPDISKPIVVLYNTSNTHWDPVVENGKKSRALGDGNCGYNSFAVSIKELAKPASELEDIKQAVVHVLKQEGKRYKLRIEETRESEKQFNNAMGALEKMNPVKYKEIQGQIEADAQLALKLAIEDLPGIAGRANTVDSYLKAIRESSATFFKGQVNSNKVAPHCSQVIRRSNSDYC